MSGDHERRLADRLDKVFSIYIRGPWGSAFGIARNISEGGMFIEALDPYPLGSKMEITFTFEDSPAEMTAEAEVVHLCFLDRTPGGGQRRVVVGMGVRFLGFVEEQADPRYELRPALVQ